METRQLDMSDMDYFFGNTPKYTREYVGSLFDDDAPKKVKQPKKKDVRVSFKAKGGKRAAVRFGIVGEAADAIRKYGYVRISNIERCRERIYIMLLTEPEPGCYKIQQSPPSSLYFSVTPKTDKAYSLWEKHYIGKDFDLKYGGTNLAYITIEEED